MECGDLDPMRQEISQYRLDFACNENEVAGGGSAPVARRLEVDADGRTHRRRHHGAVLAKGISSRDAELVYATAFRAFGAEDLRERHQVEHRRDRGGAGCRPLSKRSSR